MVNLNLGERVITIPRYDIPAIFEAAPFTKMFFDRMLAGPFFTDRASVATGREILIGLVGVGARRIDPTLSAVVLREAIRTDDDVAALGATALAVVEESGLAAGYAASILAPAAAGRTPVARKSGVPKLPAIRHKRRPR